MSTASSAAATGPLKIYFEPKDRLRLTVGEDRSYPTVKPVWAAPLAFPNRYLGLLNAKGEQIVMITDPEKELDRESLEAVRIELGRRYLTAQIETIVHAKVEFGATYWHVNTERGERDFVTQSLQENAQWLSENHLLLIDVDGNRFELRDVTKLDPRSKTILDSIL